MFRRPYRRDPLLVGWSVFLAVVLLAALVRNTQWGGAFNAERFADLLISVAVGFLLSLALVALLAFLRERFADGRASRGAAAEASALPWTDRWLRDWREAEAERAGHEVSGRERLGFTVTCRHGAALDSHFPHVQVPPLLRALSVSHHIVQPASEVTVTWCFERAEQVVVDGVPGFPACGATTAVVWETRRIELTGTNAHGSTSAATASVVALVPPRVDVPQVPSPPPLALTADVRVGLAATAPVGQRLDAFWADRDRFAPTSTPPQPLIGVPAAVVDHFRRTTKGTAR